MKLHWSPRSPFVRKVMVFAFETGLAERFDKVRSVVAMTKPNSEFMKVNPLNKIPTLVTDEGLVLFDSDVICEYLDSLHSGPKLVPNDSRERWQALHWRAFASEMLDALVLWRNESARPEDKCLPELLDAFALKIRLSLELLEREAPELARAPLSVGHIAVACMLGYLDYRFADLDWRSGHPALADWFAVFDKRDSMQRTLPTDSD